MDKRFNDLKKLKKMPEILEEEDDVSGLDLDKGLDDSESDKTIPSAPEHSYQELISDDIREKKTKYYIFRFFKCCT